MDTAKLKRFAQYARRSLIDQVTSKLVLVLAEDSAARRENSAAIKKLEEQISEHGKDQVIEKIAYIWFNRFCALRFMDVNRYTRIGLVSPVEGQFQPEILAEAKMGHIDEESVPEKIRQQIFALLGGTAPSQDPQAEAYRLLLVAACNDYHKAMPYLFERIADYTELLMPDDLLSGNSILAYTREAMTPNICQDVEVIGWLYQFYISEKKDKVFEDLKKNKKISPENIPAATQLFTSHWIVRYLVENSLGRLWMLNRPDSKIFKNMKDQGKECYYIEPSEPEIDFLRINKPEDLKLCDPACGSGHMLVYAFDLLYAIYEEEGVDPSEIPEKILTHNLFGIEIDERAGELAAFALTMKARAKQRRFFRKPVQPNICVLQVIHFDETEINEYMDFVGQDIFTLGLKTTLSQFEEADNFGSLIRPEVTNVQGILEILDTKDVSSHLFYSLTHAKVLQVLKQADYLSPKYHVVIANPPYMGGKGMNGRLGTWLKDNYPDVKSDLFSAFIVRNTELTMPKGQLGFMTPFVWMFISSYEKLRSYLINKKTITSLLQLEYSGFDGATVPICTFTVENAHKPDLKGGYVRLSDFRGSENQAPKTLEAIQNSNCGWFYRASAADFKKIPGNPIAYWFSDNAANNCVIHPTLGQFSEAKSGMSSCNSDLFLRQWFEVTSLRINRTARSHLDANKSTAKWYPYNKGGSNRRWFGYNDVVINWLNEGKDIKNFVIDNPKDPNTTHWSRRLFNLEYFFKKGLTWSAVTSGRFSCRIVLNGIILGTGSKTLYDIQSNQEEIVFSLLNTNVTSYYLSVFSPTLNFETGDVVKIPVIKTIDNAILPIEKLLSISKGDWDSYETSWDFSDLPLINSQNTNTTYPLPLSIKQAYTQLRTHWEIMTLEMQHLEQENNRIFIDAYGLQDELTSDVPLNEITLTCNPHYRYGNNKTETELETLLLADTIREFISYAVGCMFGRYALDKPGLILANQGETIEDYYKKLQEPQNKLLNISVDSCSFVVQKSDVLFPADDDNVIPMLDGDWFTDDVTERFGQFLKVTFGDAHYEENLKFIEQALGKDIRKYFLKDFFPDHWKRYKKRPIYWLFSSPKGTFNALIYMHRYRPDTVSVVLNDYLREFRTKLSAHKNHLEAVSISSNASAGEKTKALKDIENHRKMIDELDVYEREVLYPLATEQIEIDLDDGVKVNYQKFGEALKKIPGLAAKED